jgi:hypothetical protein
MKKITELKTPDAVLRAVFTFAADGPNNHGEPLRKMLIRQLESLPLSDEKQLWLHDLSERGAPFDSEPMSWAQAVERFAALHDSMRAHLPADQWAALVSRYSPLVSGANVKLVFPREKVQAINLLTDMVVDARLVCCDFLAGVLVARCFANDCEGSSIRHLAESFCLSKSTLGRIAQDVSGRIAGIEREAFGSISLYFKEVGILSA